MTPPRKIKYGQCLCPGCLEEENCPKKANEHAIHADERSLPNINSTDLLLIAHDEWKRREERRHIHEEIPWVYGWISGYLTSRKFVNERLAELHKQESIK